MLLPIRLPKSQHDACAWGVRKALHKWDWIIKKVRSRYWAKAHEFVIELPKTMAEALKIDEQTGTNFWGQLSKR